MPGKKRSTRPPRKAPRRKARKAKSNVPDMAKCSVKRTLALANGNQMYNVSNIALGDFPRAVNVAKSYQFYRIVSVKMTWKPAYDTYSTATLQQKPNLYVMMNKSAAIPTGLTLEGLKQLGARPRAFDERPLNTTWSPTVLNDSQNNLGSVAASYRVSPWLITNLAPDSVGWSPSFVQHNGIMWYMETPGVVQQIYVEIECQFEFKKPLIDISPAAPALTLAYAVLDASPDGVEGGTDGITIPLEH